ncbi:MAG: cob(I)yrinic acid a,c-diamide adenosyltransferase [Breznakibacter sp.]
MRIAAAHSTQKQGAIDQNIQETATWLKKMAEKGAELVIFPELSITGYTNHAEDVQKLAARSASIEKILVDLSRTYSCAFSAGYIVEEKGRYFIAQSVFQQGKCLHTHLKTHLSPTEQAVYSAAEALTCFELNETKIGQQLCYETHFPELSYHQAYQGAELIAMSFASPRETPPEKMSRFSHYLPARAYDNNCFVAAANATGYSASGQPLAGVAMIIHPTRGIIASSESYETGYCIAECNFNDLAARRQSRMGWFNQHKNRSWMQTFYQSEYNNITQNMSITTKTGDQGDTALFGGSRVDKDHIRITCNGEIDELNSRIGLLRAHLPQDHPWQERLLAIQRDLMLMMSHIATPTDGPKENKKKHPTQGVAACEAWIDECKAILEGDKLAFVLPGSSMVSAHCHTVRTATRTAERHLVTLNRESPLPAYILTYFNRMSDLFYLLAMVNLKVNSISPDQFMLFPSQK